jgi:hypothetical protein
MANDKFESGDVVFIFAGPYKDEFANFQKKVPGKNAAVEIRGGTENGKKVDVRLADMRKMR